MYAYWASKICSLADSRGSRYHRVSISPTSDFTVQFASFQAACNPRSSYGCQCSAMLHLLLYVVIAKFHYTDTDTNPTRTGHGPDTDKVRARCRVRAKFHYTDPTGPARTQWSFAAKKSVRVRAGPVGSVSGPCSGI